MSKQHHMQLARRREKVHLWVQSGQGGIGRKFYANNLWPPGLCNLQWPFLAVRKRRRARACHCKQCLKILTKKEDGND